MNQPEVSAGHPQPPPETLITRLDSHAATRPDQLAFVFLDEQGREAERLTFAQLSQRSARIAEGLRGSHGQRALLLYSPGSAFVCALLACFRAGVVAVPMPLPGRQKGGMQRVAMVAQNAQAAVVLTNAEAAPGVQAGLAATSIRDLPCAVTEAAQPISDSAPVPDQPHPVAYLQYTSGSTGEPKGVIISHAALLHNLEEIRLTFGHTEKTVMGSWLPTFHDMGLVGTTLHPIYMGIPSIQMSPVTFIKRPSTWLRAISEYGVTTSGGPNFAYDLCTYRIPEGELDGIDLSSWTVAFNGAEPVRAATLRAFEQRFTPYGLGAGALYPCYGLAEVTLLATGSAPGRGPVYFTADRAGLERGEAGIPLDGETGYELVGCGTSATLDVMVADPQTRAAAPDNTVGEIWIRGGSVADGYWAQPELTEKTFKNVTLSEDGPYLRTGDLGFVRDGQLYVTGRIKDLMIVNGRNIYPQDVEGAALQVHPSVRAAAAFTVEGMEREMVTVVLEAGALDGAFPNDLLALIRRRVSTDCGIALAGIVVVTVSSFARTTSGKVMRSEMRKRFLSSQLEIVADDMSEDLKQVLIKNGEDRHSVAGVLP